MWSEQPVPLPVRAPETREPPQAASAEGEAARCTACAEGVLAPRKVRSAFWDADRLVVVEDVPALVCQSCAEQYFTDETAMKLDLIRGNGFRDAEAERRMEVPVFAFGRALAAGRKG